MNIAYTELLPQDYRRNETVLYSACYLCGSTEKPLEEEHVVPKILFKSIKPNNYIKLKACKICNRAKGIEDEYVGRLLQGTSFNDHANFGIAEAFRGMGKGHGLGIYNDQMNRSYPTPAEGINGVKVSSGVIKPPIDRVNNFQITIVKGLWTTLSNRIFDWNDYDFITLSRQTLAEPDLLEDETLIASQNDARYRQNWEGVFKYAGDFKDDEVSYWVTTYYDAHVAVSAIKKKGIGNIDLYDYIFEDNKA